MYRSAPSAARPVFTKPMVTVRSARTARAASPLSPFMPLGMSTLTTRAPAAFISPMAAA